MRNIAIVGAGQSGLQLGISLLKANYQVTLYNDCSVEQIANGCVVSSPALFESSLHYERTLGIHLWEDLCPKNNVITFFMGNQAELLLNWQGKTKHPFQAVDPRVKMPAWIELFITYGGKFIVESINGLQQLEAMAVQFDLTVIATGKGNLSRLFEVDTEKSIFTESQRALALFYVDHIKINESLGVRFSALPGVGEFFTMSGLTTSGPCEMMLFEGLLNGLFDCWQEVRTNDARLAKAKELLEKYFPWEASRFQHARLTDDKATFTGKYTPMIRHPVLQLSSGRVVLGMGDAIVLNDPISGQGANCASKCANIYSQCIQERGQRIFDLPWMQETFNKYWAYAKWVTRWTNILLQPPKPHFVCLMQAASENKKLANYLAELFEYPPYLFPWIDDENETQKIIKQFCSF